jgi:hypothetical protein
MVLGIWIGTFSRRYSTKSRLVTLPEKHALCKGVAWDQYSVDVGAVFNKLFWDELVHMGRIVERICQIGQVVERS